jgi:hypothetical protein
MMLLAVMLALQHSAAGQAMRDRTKLQGLWTTSRASGVSGSGDQSTLECANEFGIGARALNMLCEGLIRLRPESLGTDRAVLDRAQAYFDEAIYRAPDNWPWPWYGLALTDLALDSAGYTVKPSMHQPAGMYYRDAAIRALGMALAADSGFAPAAQLLA